MNIVGDIIEMFVPFLKVIKGRIFFIPPVLGFTLVELLTAFKIHGCVLSTTLVPKSEADVSTYEEGDIFIINQALDIVNDPLTTTECIENTLRTINIKYGLGTVVAPVNEGFGYMTIDATDDLNVFTIYE